MSLKRICDRCGTSDPAKLRNQIGMLEIMVKSGCFADASETGSVVISERIDLCCDCLINVPDVIETLLGRASVSRSEESILEVPKLKRAEVTKETGSIKSGPKRALISTPPLPKPPPSPEPKEDPIAPPSSPEEKEEPILPESTQPSPPGEPEPKPAAPMGQKMTPGKVIFDADDSGDIPGDDF